jgi:hypothetical protein
LDVKPRQFNQGSSDHLLSWREWVALSVPGHEEYRSEMTRKNLGRRAAGFRNELSLGHVEPDVLMI